MLIRILVASTEVTAIPDRCPALHICETNEVVTSNEYLVLDVAYAENKFVRNLPVPSSSLLLYVIGPRLLEDKSDNTIHQGHIEEVEASMPSSVNSTKVPGGVALLLKHSSLVYWSVQLPMSQESLLVEKPKASVNRPPTPDVVENPPEREPTLQELINIKLIETGEKERLMELLRERLVDCGWKDEMKALCRAVVKKKGRNNVTVDELVHVITPKGRASVPDSIKAELLQRIRSFLVSAAL
ncbi:hypothetical protein VNO77_16600 [Canavalia gladiata]|uniref:Transcription and mRNA export factor ENY2 n=1 Tax=Canavalia gladiata TaxID=3824 RepID=A0AAN9LI33_CANGL